VHPHPRGSGISCVVAVDLVCGQTSGSFGGKGVCAVLEFLNRFPDEPRFDIKYGEALIVNCRLTGEVFPRFLPFLHDGVSRTGAAFLS
jgi:hypothetical protein